MDDILLGRAPKGSGYPLQVLAPPIGVAAGFPLLSLTQEGENLLN